MVVICRNRFACLAKTVFPRQLPSNCTNMPVVNAGFDLLDEIEDENGRTLGEHGELATVLSNHLFHLGPPPNRNPSLQKP